MSLFDLTLDKLSIQIQKACPFKITHGEAWMHHILEHLKDHLPHMIKDNLVGGPRMSQAWKKGEFSRHKHWTQEIQDTRDRALFKKVMAKKSEKDIAKPRRHKQK
jgi:hypothetical protein